MRGNHTTNASVRRGVSLALGMLVAGSASFVSMAANAQENILEEITVTATKRAQSLQDVPISVATMQGEKLNTLFSGSEDVLALSGRVPGLYAESSNGRAAPRFYMRGLGNIDFDLGASQPVSFIMDDVVMENVVLKSFPLFDVDNIEVIRGPQGTLFGRNTPAGILKINTRRPDQETSGYVRGSLGTNTTANLEGAVGGAFTDTLSARFSGLIRTRNNYIDNGFTGEEDALGKYTDYAGRVQLLWEPTDNFRALFSAQTRDLKGTSSIFRANVFNTGSNSLNQNYDRETVYYDGGDNNPQEYESNGYTLNLEWDVGSVTLYSITSAQDAKGSSRGDIDGGVVDFSGTAEVPPGITFDPAAPVFGGTALTFPGTITVPSVTEDGADTEQFTQEFRISSDPDSSFRWQGGFFYFDSDLKVTTDSFASFGFDGRQVDTRVQYENTAWALFGQVEWDFTDRLTAVAGVRFTEDEKDYRVLQYGALWTDIGIPNVPDQNVSDDNVSWDLALNWGLSDSSTLFTRLAQGFRAQTIQGRDVAFLEFPSIAKPETITSFEVGYKGDLMNDKLRINTAVFYYEVDDMQLSIIGGGSNVNQVVNAAKGAATGLELDFTWLVTDNLEFGGGFSVIDTEIQDPNLYALPCGSGLCTPLDPPNPNGSGQVLIDGNPFPRVPDTNITLTARYSIPMGSNGEFFAFLDWTMNGDINMPLYEAVEFKTSNQHETGLRIGYQGYEGWEVALFGRNITDEDNVLGFIDFSNNTGFVNEGALWGLEASYAFGQ